MSLYYILRLYQTRSMVDVHRFDGHLKETLIPYRSKLKEISEISPDVKKLFINKFRDMFSDSAKRTIDMICTLTGNDENTNSLNALDVLYLALTADMESSYIKNIDEQLSDVVNPGGGICPSGRTTRIIQLYIQFVESKDMAIESSKSVNSTNLDIVLKK